MKLQAKLRHKTCAICGKGFETRTYVNHKSTKRIVRHIDCLTCSKKCARTYDILVHKFKLKWFNMGYKKGLEVGKIKINI